MGRSSEIWVGSGGSVIMENGTDRCYFAVLGEVACKLGVSRGQFRPRDLDVRTANAERYAFTATAPSVLQERQRRMRVLRDEGPRVTIGMAILGGGMAVPGRHFWGWSCAE